MPNSFEFSFFEFSSCRKLRLMHWGSFPLHRLWRQAILPLNCKTQTQRNLFEILLNQPEIWSYLPFSDWFGSKRTSVRVRINRKMVNTIWFRVYLIRFRKYFSVCRQVHQTVRTLHPLSKTLAALDILRVQWRSPLKSPIMIVLCWCEGFQVGSQLGPTMRPGDARISDCCIFQSVTKNSLRKILSRKLQN